METIFLNGDNQNIMMLQYLMELGARGNHPLFETEEIRKAFGRDMKELSQIAPETVEEINSAIKNILQAPDMETQKDIITELAPDIRDILVILYFQMLDQNLLSATPTKH